MKSVACPSFLSEKIMLHCQLCLTCLLHSSKETKNCLKPTSVIKVATITKKIQGLICTQLSSESEISITIHSKTQSKRTFVIKAFVIKAQWHYGHFPLCKGSHHVQPPNRHYSLSAKMNTKEDTGQSMKNSMLYAKRLNSEISCY